MILGLLGILVASTSVLWAAASAAEVPAASDSLKATRGERQGAGSAAELDAASTIADISTVGAARLDSEKESLTRRLEAATKSLDAAGSKNAAARATMLATAKTILADIDKLTRDVDSMSARLATAGRAVQGGANDPALARAMHSATDLLTKVRGGLEKDRAAAVALAARSGSGGATPAGSGPGTKF